jgi:hypothetical protein
MISKSLRLTTALVIGMALSFGITTVEAAKSSHETTSVPPSSTNTKVKPALETCSPGQHCTGMPHPKCITEYVAVCHRHHLCQTVKQTVCS